MVLSVLLGGWWWGAAEVAVAQPVGVALEGEDLGVVDEAVDHGGGHDVVGEDLAPAPERLVAGADEGGAFVAGRDELEEQVRRLGLERDVADLVDDQQRVAAEADQLWLQSAGGVGVGEAGDPLAGGGERDPVPGLAGPDGQPDGQVGLAGARWAEEDHVLAGGDEVQGVQVGDEVAAQSAGVVEVDLLQGLAGREPGGRMRPSPPWDSWAETSRCRHASR